MELGGRETLVTVVLESRDKSGGGCRGNFLVSLKPASCNEPFSIKHDKADLAQR